MDRSERHPFGHNCSAVAGEPVRRLSREHVNLGLGRRDDALRLCYDATPDRLARYATDCRQFRVLESYVPERSGRKLWNTQNS